MTPHLFAHNTLIANLVRLGLEYLPADKANEEIVRLNVKIFELEAEIDKMTLLRELDMEDGG